MDLLSKLGEIFIPRPWMALIPVAAFAGLYLLSRSRTVLAAALAWLVYVAWELTIKLRWTCSGDCDIRVDLLLLYPVLLALSALAIVRAGVSLVRRTR
jgi:hypothetical protein